MKEQWYVVRYKVAPYDEMQHVLTLAPSMMMAIAKAHHDLAASGILASIWGGYLDAKPGTPPPIEGKRRGRPPKNRNTTRT